MRNQLLRALSTAARHPQELDLPPAMSDLEQ